MTVPCIAAMSPPGRFGIARIVRRAGDTDDTGDEADDTPTCPPLWQDAGMQNDATIAELTHRLEEAERMNALLRSTIAHLADGFAICEPDGRYFTYNDAMRALNGVPLDVTFGSYWEAVAWQWREGHAVGHRGATLEEHLAERRRRFETADGAPTIGQRPSGRWIESRIWPLPDGRRVIVHHDISDLKRREIELDQAKREAEEARATLQTVLDNVTDGIALIEPGGERFLLHNAAIVALNRWPEELLARGLPLRELYAWQFENGHVQTEHRDAASFVEALCAEIRAAEGRPVVNRRPHGAWVERRFIRLSGGRVLVMHRDVTALKEREAEIEAARAAAEEARETLQTVLDSVTDGIGLLDSEGRPLLMNDAIYALNRWPRDQFEQGWTLRDVLRWQFDNAHVPHVDGESVEDYVDRLVAEVRAGAGHPVVYRPPHGTWIERRFIRLSGDRTLLMHRDVTALKLREAEIASERDAAQAVRAELERARSLMQTVLDNMIDGVALAEADGTWLLANRAITTINDMPEGLMARLPTMAEVLGWQVRHGHIALDGATPEEAIAAALARFADADGEATLRRRPNGHWVEVRFLALPDGRRMVLHRDVTELKRREAEAEEARETMKTVLDHMPDAVVLFDGDGSWRYASAALSRIQDTTEAVLAANPTFHRMVEWQAREGQFGSAEATAEYIRGAIRRFDAADGETRLRQRRNGRWTEISFHRIPGGGTLGLYRDVTTLKAQEELLARERDAAETASRAKSAFLATMSHEIRTPMNGVVGMLDVLEHEGLTPAQRGIVETMRASAAALLRIVDDVLDFSKIEAGRLELEETPFDLGAVLAATAEALRPQAEAKGLALDIDVPMGGPALLGDPTRVGQILFNLLGNAVKFTESGQVAVHAAATPAPDGRLRVTLAVADTGIGLDEAARERLFEPFTQADSSTTRRFGGTGLGLSIVRRLVALMEGEVAVESTPGEGTTFTVTLMLRAAPAAAPAPSPPAPAGTATARGQRVLVVDDHPVNRDVLVRQLALLGVAADAAEDGPAALGLLRCGGYGALLADIHMPGMDGYALAAALRALEGADAPRLPIVAVTANAMKGEAERCLAAGMDGYLAKPVTVARLREVLAAWLPLQAVAEPTPAPRTQGTGALDAGVLEAWFGTDRAAMAELLDRFVETAEAAAPALRAAVARADWRALHEAAHRLKGAARAVGANPLAEAADALERAGTEGATVGLAALSAALPAALEAARAATRAYRRGA
jgi:signal transduction histidine kinase/DNA-binding response OmpR family regulator